MTTSSLEALRLYTQGDRARNAGRVEESVAPLRAGHRRSIPTSPWPGGSSPSPCSIPAATPNASLPPHSAPTISGTRLPRREADLAIAYYFQTSGNRPQAIEAYQRMLASWPDDIPARNNLALLLNVEGRYPEAERILKTAIDSGASPRPSSTT